jgi:hypothetical protein
MTPKPLPGELRTVAEDPGALVAIGPDEERILTDRRACSASAFVRSAGRGPWSTESTAEPALLTTSWRVRLPDHP